MVAVAAEAVDRAVVAAVDRAVLVVVGATTTAPIQEHSAHTYNKYCPIHGVNLQCNGGTECRCNPKTTNTEATYKDPRGGSRRNWVKYRELCGPDNQHYKTEAEYYATI